MEEELETDSHEGVIVGLRIGHVVEDWRGAVPDLTIIDDDEVAGLDRRTEQGEIPRRGPLSDVGLALGQLDVVFGVRDRRLSVGAREVRRCRVGADVEE